MCLNFVKELIEGVFCVCSKKVIDLTIVCFNLGIVSVPSSDIKVGDLIFVEKVRSLKIYSPFLQFLL